MSLMNSLLRHLIFPVLAGLAGVTRADVTPAVLFGDHAVLQRDKPVPVWGSADPGERVTVKFEAQVCSTTTGSDGRWIVLLEPVALRTQGTDLTISGRNTITLHDIVVGEVWLCSGQSNMAFTVSRAANAAQETATANFSLIRHLAIERTMAKVPAESVKAGGWRSATRQEVGAFTAVGYFFARDIHQKLGVPVGLIHSSWGGTPIEAWMSPAALAANPAFRMVGERWQQAVAAYPEAKTAYEAQLAAWTNSQVTVPPRSAAAQAAWAKKNPRPREPQIPLPPAGLFNGMINPLLPYALRGVLWYQGENNAGRAAEYHDLFAAMITHWRAHFGQGDIPFYWVNLANFKNPTDQTGKSYAFLREAQTQTLSLPNTGQALAIDLGDPNDIHPTNKQDVGRRLALLARKRIYGIVGDDTGPTFAGIGREGPALRVRFTHVGGGLIAHDKPVQSLEVAGADKVFHRAAGTIERDTLLVSSPAVREPVAVRYAWQNAPEANLYNGAGLPAVPFRSDTW